MPSTIFTHDRIDLAAGILSQQGVLWGGNAIQSITIGRHTPKTPQQAVGYLGIVDYNRGTITSDLSIDCILTEQTALASANSSIYKFADDELVVGAESYVLTSCSVAFQAGNPVAVNYGFLTSSIASALAIKARPAPSTGENSPFAVLMGDDGSGIKIVVDDYTAQSYAEANSTVGGADSGGLNYIDPADGTIKTMTDGGVPGGLQSLTFNARLNRDNVLDVRSSVPVQFITTYPLDLVADMELYVLPTAPRFDRFKTITVSGAGRTYGVDGADADTDPDDGGFVGNLVKAYGLSKVDEQESVSVGRFRAFTMNYICSDIELPINNQV